MLENTMKFLHIWTVKQTQKYLTQKTLTYTFPYWGGCPRPQNITKI